MTRTRYIVLFLVFVVLGVYYPVLFAPTNSVDDRGMIQSIINTEHVSFRELFLPGTSGYYYRPLLWSTYLADKDLWGLEPSFMHLENILLHAINTILIFFITVLISKRYNVESRTFPLLAALLFALHPINTEAVNWISGRTDVLAGLFILLSILFLLKALETDKVLFLALSSVSFLSGCLAKEVAVFFYPAALILIFCYDDIDKVNLSGIKRFIYKRALYVILFSGMTTLYFLFRHFAFKQSDNGLGHLIKNFPHAEADISAIILNRLLDCIKVFGFYCKKLFIPWPQNFTIISVSDWYIAVGIIFVLFCFYLAYKRNLVSAFFLTSASFIVPAVLAALTRIAWTPYAERYLYISNTTFSIGIVYAAYVAFKRFQLNRIVPYVIVLIVSLFAYTTVNRNIVWQDNLTLYQDAVEKTSGYPPVKNELAKALIEHGRLEEGMNILKSNRADKSFRNREFAELGRANVMFFQGDAESARKLLLKNLNTSSGAYVPILTRLIKIDEERLKAAEEENKMIKIRHEIIDLYLKLNEVGPSSFYSYRIGQIYLAMHKNREARDFFAKAYNSAPDNAYYKLPAKKLAEKLDK